MAKRFDRKKFEKQIENALTEFVNDANKIVRTTMKEAVEDLCQGAPVWSGSYVASIRAQVDNNPVEPPTNLKQDPPEGADYGWPAKLEDIGGPEAVEFLRDESSQTEQEKFDKLDITKNSSARILNNIDHAVDVEVGETYSGSLQMPFKEVEVRTKLRFEKRVKQMSKKRYT